MKKLVVLVAFALSGCMTMTPATYMVSADAKAALQKYQGSKVSVAEIADPPAFDPMCRAVGIAFSTSAGITGGWWDIGLTLRSSNGASMALEHKYEFEAGFAGAGACNNASRAFGPAVQQLVHKSITDPRVASLLR